MRIRNRKLAYAGGLLLVCVLIITTYIRRDSDQKVESKDLYKKILCVSPTRNGSFKIWSTLSLIGGAMSTTDFNLYFAGTEGQPTLLFHARDINSVRVRCQFDKAEIIMVQIPTSFDQKPKSASENENVDIKFFVEECLTVLPCALRGWITEIEKARARLRQKLITASDEAVSEQIYEELKREFDAFQVWVRVNKIGIIKD